MVALIAVLAGCTETVQLARDPLADIVSLDVLPADSTIKITDLGLPHHTLQFTAMAGFADGTSRDVTSLVTWSLDNGPLGAIDTRGLLTASHEAAGYGRVTARARGLEASTQLTVIIDATVVDPSFPPPAADLFDPANPYVIGDPMRSPTLIYPADGTTFPPNIASTLFQYLRGSGNDAFRVVFDSEVLHLAIETGTDRWQAAGSLQRLLAATGRSGPIRSEVHATSSAGPAIIYVGNRITLAFAPEAPPTPLYFWSAAESGIMIGGVDVASAGRLYPPSMTCVGCHAVSRDGRRLVMGMGDEASPELHAIDVGTLTPVIATSPSRPMGWATYSPDGAHVLVANDGRLTLYDAASGADLGDVPLPPMRYATHPDWSPDGRYVAVALTAQTPTNLDVKAASIARIAYTSGTWGTPEILVAGSNANNNYFPRWSPDGTYLVFVRATTASRGATSAELMLVPAAGGTTRRLRLASHRVGTRDDVPDLANTMPTWAPHLDGTRTWLAFVSARPYGAVLPSAGRGQIWVSAIDLANTDDPSSPAFWLPCQDATVLNNNPVWSKTDLTQ
jgi:hypothetical protein